MPQLQLRRLKRRHGVLLAGGGIVASLVLSGCGGSAGTASSASADPIKTMTVAAINSQTGSWPNNRTAAEVAVDKINADGGVGGRKIELIFCDSQGTPAGLAKCAQQAVQEKVTAVVGGFLLSSSAMISVLEKAGIAWIGSAGADNAEYHSKVVFEMGGQLAWQSASGYLAAKSGCSSLAVLPPDIPAAAIALKVIKNGFVSGGGSADHVTTFPFPPGTADLTTYAARASKAQCVLPFVGQQILPGFLSSLNSIGSSQRLISFQGTLIPATASKFLKYTNGAAMGGNFANWETSPAWADFRQALAKAKAPNVDYGGSYAQLTWAAYMAFKNIAKPIADKLDNKTFLEAASKASAVDTGGLLKPLDFTTKFDGLDGQFSRYFNRYAMLFTWKDGKPVSQGDFVDMTNAIEGKPLQ